MCAKFEELIDVLFEEQKRLLIAVEEVTKKCPCPYTVKFHMNFVRILLNSLEKDTEAHRVVSSFYQTLTYRFTLALCKRIIEHCVANANDEIERLKHLAEATSLFPKDHPVWQCLPLKRQVKHPRIF